MNYFPYVGYDPATGTATETADWDTKFTLVEVFNDSSWKENRNGSVADWLGMLKAGRKVFATGSSDTHRIAGSPVGYPRTCLALGTDDPRQITPNLVRDTLAAGHTTVSGGIYVTARLGTAGPGDTTTGAGSPQQVDVTIQAPTWIDVTGIDVIVDGETVDTIPVMPGDADAEPGDPLAGPDSCQCSSRRRLRDHRCLRRSRSRSGAPRAHPVRCHQSDLRHSMSRTRVTAVRSTRRESCSAPPRSPLLRAFAVVLLFGPEFSRNVQVDELRLDPRELVGAGCAE